MTYDNSNSGALFKNDRKRPDRQDPDYTGKAEIAGSQYYVDGWINEVKDQPGRKYLKLKYKPVAPKAAAPAPAAASTEPEFNDDIPF